MIVVVGSRHDQVATRLVATWKSAALCSAEDLTRAGWAWEVQGRARRTWVVDGALVDDADVTGVFLRRSAVYPEELTSTHSDDRAYLAAEAHAFLVFVLASTRATVVNPVVDGGFGEEALRHERTVQAAAEGRIAIAPLTLASRTIARRRITTTTIDVVGNDTFGKAPAGVKRDALTMARRLGIRWANFVFDGRQRLLTVTSSRPPGPDATAALEHVLTAQIAA